MDKQRKTQKHFREENGNNQHFLSVSMKKTKHKHEKFLKNLKK